MNKRHICLGVALFSLAARLPAEATSWAVAVDQGTGAAGMGIQAYPALNVAPNTGGNTLTQGLTIINAFDDFGLPQASLNGMGVTPTGDGFASAISATGSLAVGVVGLPGGGFHAARWFNDGGIFAFTDLHPSGYANSVAESVDASGNTVGWATEPLGNSTPMLLASATLGFTPQALSLPAGFLASPANQASVAVAAFGDLYIGGEAASAGGQLHPLVWNNLAGHGYQATDLMSLLPNAISGTLAAGGWTYQYPASGGTAFFAGSITLSGGNGLPHAAIWFPYSNTPQALDLHPVGTKYVGSSIFAARLMVPAKYSVKPEKFFEVGEALVMLKRNLVTHAMVWIGASTTPTDLQKLLPAGFTQSVATGVDEAGNIEGAALDASQVWHAVEWVRQ